MPRNLKIEFGPITHSNIEQLRKINTVSFPIQYNEGFYQDVIKRNDEALNKFAYCNEFVVGAVCARVEEADTTASSGTTTKKRLYIMTLAVLAAYRGRGIGSELLRSVLDYCDQQRRNSGGGGEAPIAEIALHVQISNDDAIRFYTEKFGFIQGDMVENYYRRIDPPHCYLLYKTLDDDSPEQSDNIVEDSN